MAPSSSSSSRSIPARITPSAPAPSARSSRPTPTELSSEPAPLPFPLGGRRAARIGATTFPDHRSNRPRSGIPESSNIELDMKRTLFIKSSALLAACSLALGVGCSSDNGLNLARVRGKVTFKGEPVKKGTVFFYPDRSKGTVGPSAVGGITDGTYIASTEYGDDGVIVGSHKVGLSGVDAATADELAAAKDSTAAGTGVEAGKSTVAVIQAKAKSAGAGAARKRQVDLFTDAGGKKWRYLVPKKLSDPDQSGVTVKIERGSNTIDFEISEDGHVRVSQ